MRRSCALELANLLRRWTSDDGEDGRTARVALAACRGKLAMQALYQWQLTGQSSAELRNQYAARGRLRRGRCRVLRAMLRGRASPTARRRSMRELGALIDRPVAQLDPVEHAILLIGLHELVAAARHAVPRRDQRRRRAGEEVRRHRRPQVRQRRARPGGAQRCARRSSAATRTRAAPEPRSLAMPLGEFDLIARYLPPGQPARRRAARRR